MASHVARLPRVEAWFYMLTWIGCIAYVVVTQFKVSLDYGDQLNAHDFDEGWSFIGRKRDISNFEWSFWSEWFLEAWHWLAGHIVVSLVLRSHIKLYELRKPLYILYSLITLSSLLSIKSVLVILGHCLVSYLVSCLGFSILTWMMTLCLVSTLNHKPFTTILKLANDNDTFEKKYYLLMFTIAMCNIRNTSFSLTKIEQKKNNQNGENDQTDGNNQNEAVMECTFMDQLLYVLYLPLYATGPLVNFDIFYKNFHRPHKPIIDLNWRWIIKQTLRVGFWVLILELAHHTLYYNSFITNGLVLRSKLSLWALAGVGYCRGQFFMVVYVILFGLPAIIAKFDDIDVPEGPICISRVYKYSQMWRCFDRGLYNFIARHIYIPLGGSRKGLLRQIFASMCSFTYIAIWHGAEYYLFIWCAMNFVGIAMESSQKYFSTSTPIVKLQGTLGGAMVRRLTALMVIPQFLVSVIAIFIFFGGRNFGLLQYRQILINGWPTSTLTTVFFLYCCIQTAMEIEIWEQKRKTKTE